MSALDIYQDRIDEAQVRLGELPRWRFLARRRLRFQIRLYRRRLWCDEVVARLREAVRQERGES